MFGGTFNPIHYGHLNSLESVQKDLNLEQVWVVPAAQNPLREKIEVGPAPEDRVEMVRRAMPLINQDVERFIVRTNEMSRGGTSYTIDTLKEFNKEREADFHLIIGADQLEQFEKWKDYKSILKLANLVVTTRPGVQLPSDKSEMQPWLRSLIRSFKDGKGSLTTGRKLFYVRLRDVDVSSTDIRRRVRNKENVGAYTPSPVVEYIEEKKLYQGGSLKIGDFGSFTRFCARILDEKGGLNIAGYDLRSYQQPAEFTLAASGTSTRHTKALAEHIVKQVKDEFGVYPQGTEGIQEGRWIVVDYGATMIHLFYDFVRNEYRIEELWREAPSLSLR